MAEDNTTNEAQAYSQPPEPSPDLKRLDRLVGTWETSGGAPGQVSFEWMEGGFFLIQYVDLEQYGQKIKGMEIIGHERPFGEELHALRKFLFFANEGNVRKHQPEGQTEQALCLNLLADAVIAWNTVQYEKILTEMRLGGYPLNAEDLVHLSPTRYGHINPYGRYHFNLDSDPEATSILTTQ